MEVNRMDTATLDSLCGRASFLFARLSWILRNCLSIGNVIATRWVGTLSPAHKTKSIPHTGTVVMHAAEIVSFHSVGRKGDLYVLCPVLVSARLEHGHFSFVAVFRPIASNTLKVGPHRMKLLSSITRMGRNPLVRQTSMQLFQQKPDNYRRRSPYALTRTGL